jgi:hypothetical protein
MFPGALQAASGRIQEAAEGLQNVWVNVRDHWQDRNATRFEEDYLRKLFAQVQASIPAITQMSQVLGQAMRECSEPELGDRL